MKKERSKSLKNEIASGFVTLTILLTLFTQNSPAYTVYLSLDKSTYNYDDTISITGQVNATGFPALPESVSEVRIVINDSSGIEYNNTLDFSTAEYLDAFGYGQNYGYGWGYSHLGINAGEGYGYDEGSTTTQNNVYGDRGKLTYTKSVSASSVGSGTHTAKIYVNGRLYAYQTFTVNEEEDDDGGSSSKRGSLGMSAGGGGGAPKVFFDLQLLSLVEVGYGSVDIPIQLKYSSQYGDTLSVTIRPEGMPEGMDIAQKTVSLPPEEWVDVVLDGQIAESLSSGNYSIWVRAEGYSGITGPQSGSIGILLRVLSNGAMKEEEVEEQEIIEKINATGLGCLEDDCTYHPYVAPEIVKDNVVRLIVSSEFELVNISVIGKLPEEINASLARVYLLINETFVDITDDPEYNVTIDSETGKFTLMLPHLSTQTLIITEVGVDVEEAVAEPPEEEEEEKVDTGISSEEVFEDAETGNFEIVLNNPLTEDCESCFLIIEIKDTEGNVVHTETRILDVLAGSSVIQDIEINFDGYEIGEFSIETSLYKGDDVVDEASKIFTLATTEVISEPVVETPESAGFDWTLPIAALGTLLAVGLIGGYLVKKKRIDEDKIEKEIDEKAFHLKR